MKNILVPTDFSNDAYNALHYATKLFGSEKCNFYLLNVCKPQSKLKPVLASKEERAEKEEDALESSEEGLLATYHKIMLDNTNPGHEFTTICKTGNLIDVIAKTVNEKNIDLVVMGNKGKTSAKDLLLGGNTTRAVGKMKLCPILMVPREFEFTPLKEIAFATYFKRHFSADLIAPISAIASLFDSSVRVVQINERKLLDRAQKANRDVLSAYLNPIKHSFHWMPFYTEKSRVIDQFVEELAIQMLVMINYDHNLIEKIIREPVILELTSNLNIPFLVIPNKD